MISPVKIWRNQKKIAGLVGKTGTIVAFTLIRVPPADFVDQAPYAVAIVRMENGKNLTAQLVDCELDQIVAGKKVVTVVRRILQPNEEGIIPYGIKVKPLW